MRFLRRDKTVLPSPEQALPGRSQPHMVASVLFETSILRWKERFAWGEALGVAVSMSFISMLGMELAANTTDYLLTGGTTSPSEPWYWVALAISLVVGFLAPLPYNYYKLEKHGKGCH